MKPLSYLSKITAALLIAFTATSSWADLKEVKERGELRHLGIKYANFVTGAGDGFDVELTRGFAQYIGVKHTLVYTDFYTVVRDLLGKDVVRDGSKVSLTGDFPIKGDMIATGFTRLPWRDAIVLFSEPTFPSQVLLIAPANKDIKPIKETNDIKKDIEATKSLIGKNSLLVMEKTCLDPASYGLKNAGFDIKPYTRSTNINEMVPALLDGKSDLSLLDMPSLILDLQKWSGKIKVLGPISEHQELAAAFPKESPELRKAYNEYLAKIKADGTYDKLVTKYYPGMQKIFPEFFGKK